MKIIYFYIYLLLFFMFTSCISYNNQNFHNTEKCDFVLKNILNDIKKYDCLLKKSSNETFIGEGIYISILDTDNLYLEEGIYYYSLDSLLSLNKEKEQELLLLLAISAPKNRTVCVFGDRFVKFFYYKNIEDTKLTGELPSIKGDDTIIKVDNTGYYNVSAISTGNSSKAYLTDYPIAVSGGVLIQFKHNINENSNITFYNDLNSISTNSITVIDENSAKINISLKNESYKIISNDVYFGGYNNVTNNIIEYTLNYEGYLELDIEAGNDFELKKENLIFTGNYDNQKLKILVKNGENYVIENSNIIKINENYLGYLNVNFDIIYNEEKIGENKATILIYPQNFIRIKANKDFGTEKDFYVSKYEMKIKGIDDGNQIYNANYQAESRATGTPWVNMNQTQAKLKCMEMRENFYLISNAEWMTIAVSIEKNPKNWSDNSTHLTGRTNAKLNIGHSCRKGFLGIDGRKDQYPYSGEGLSASFDDNEGCYGYVKGDYEDSVPTLNENGWNEYRRTFYLEDNAVIWDFSGNVWEWVDMYIPLAKDRARVMDIIDNNFLEINMCNSTNIMPDNFYKSYNKELGVINNYYENYPEDDMNGGIINLSTNYNRLGRYHPTNIDYDAGAAMRGGNYMHGSCNNGIYSIGMGYSESAVKIDCIVGFRAVWRF